MIQTPQLPDQFKIKITTVLNDFTRSVTPLLTKTSGIIWKSDPVIITMWSHLKDLIEAIKNDLIKYDAVKAGFCCDNTKEYNV